MAILERDNRKIFASQTQDSLGVSGLRFRGNSISNDELFDKHDIRYWGAVGDGATDDTQAIQNCLDYASGSGGYVTAGHGETYLITSPITIQNTVLDLHQSTIYITGSHDGVKIYENSTLQNGIVHVSKSVDYTSQSAVFLGDDREYFVNPRIIEQRSSGIQNIRIQGPGNFFKNTLPAPQTGSVVGATGAGLTLRVSGSGDDGPNIAGTFFRNFEIVGFDRGIHLHATNTQDGIGYTPYINSNYFTEFAIKGCGISIDLEQNTVPDHEISGSAGFSSAQRAGTSISNNSFSDFVTQTVGSVKNSYINIRNFGQKNSFTNFVLFDWESKNVDLTRSPYKDVMRRNTGNGFDVSGGTDPVPPSIVNLSSKGGNVYEGNFLHSEVYDRAYVNPNLYRSKTSEPQASATPIENQYGKTYSKYTNGLGDQNDFLAYAYERGLTISQSRTPDSVEGNKYSTVSDGISTVFQPYGNGYVTYNSVTESVILDIGLDSDELKSALYGNNTNEDNTFFKGVSLQFREQEYETGVTSSFFQTPEHVKIELVRQSGDTAELLVQNGNTNLYLHHYGNVVESLTNPYTNLRISFSSSIDQDNPVSLERVSMLLSSDDSKAFLGRSDERYYGDLTMKPVYGRNSDGTKDETNIINDASLTISGSIATKGATYLDYITIEGSTGGSTDLGTSTYDRVTLVKVEHDGVSVGAHTITLPAATDSANRKIRFISNSTTNANHRVEIIPGSGDTLDGSTGAFNINRNYEGVMVWCDGTEWYMIQQKNV